MTATSGGDREAALRMLRQVVLDRHFTEVSGSDREFGIYECQQCWALVDREGRQLHFDWHLEIIGVMEKVLKGLLDGGDG